MTGMVKRFILTMLGVIVLAIAPIAANDTKVYTWPGQVIAFEEESATLTVEVPVQPHVLQYIDRFEEGQRVMIMWKPSTDGRKVEAVRYIEAHEDTILSHGYVLPVEFVGADADRKRLSVKTQVPAAALDVIRSVGMRGHVAVTVPWQQEDETAVISDIAPSEPPLADIPRGSGLEGVQ